MMFSETDFAFFQNGLEIPLPRALGARTVSPSETFEYVIQTGRETGVELANILTDAGIVDAPMESELRKEQGISEIYESEGIVSERLFQILRGAAPDDVFGAKVSLIHQNGKSRYPCRFLLMRKVLNSAGSDEVPGVYFWGATSFKPAQAEGKRIFLLSQMDDAGPGPELQGLHLKLLCVDENLAQEIQSADLAGVQLSEFRI